MFFSAVLSSKFHHFRRSERSAKPLRTARRVCRANRFYTVLLCRSNIKLHHLTIWEGSARRIKPALIIYTFYFVVIGYVKCIKIRSFSPNFLNTWDNFVLINFIGLKIQIYVSCSYLYFDGWVTLASGSNRKCFCVTSNVVLSIRFIIMIGWPIWCVQVSIIPLMSLPLT